MTISVLILANKYDHSLARAVSSAAWADEVLIGWTGDRDPSKVDKESMVQIVPQIKIVRIPGLITDFSATRNQLHPKVTSDWVFWLDSDEVICNESIFTIKAVMEKREFAGAVVHRQDIFGGKTLKWGEARNVKILRMFRQTSGSFLRPVHEVAVVTGEVADPGILIDHYAHSTISSFITKVVSYAQIEAMLRYRKGRKSNSVELVVWPIGKFLRNMIFQLAFLDGWQGISYALVMSIHSLTVRARLIELWQQDRAKTAS